MSQENLADNKAECKVIMKDHYQRLTLTFNGGKVIQVIDEENYIKLEAFKPEYKTDYTECTGFTISIRVTPTFEPIKRNY